jgi:hypothetical protein
VSLLKKAVGDYQEQDELPALVEEPIDVNSPTAVLATRKVKHQGEEIKQVLIHWKDRSADEATWEDEIMIRSQFPSFDLEDKVNTDGGGIDRAHVADEDRPQDHLIHHPAGGPRVLKVYSRRKGKTGIGG